MRAASLLIPVAFYLWTRYQTDTASGGSGGALVFTDDEAHNERILTPTIRTAARDYGVPFSVLRNTLFIESNFRKDIIEGETISSAGAVGIAQIIPRWHPAVDPLDPVEAIQYAAYYLDYLKGRFGTWEKAAAAYNWGEGNLSKYGYASAPSDVKEYARFVVS